MAIIPMNKAGHLWVKQNLVTIVKARKNYDIMKCAACGIEGKTVGLTDIKLKDSYGAKITQCPKWNETQLPKVIRITRCTAMGPLFANLQPGTQHDVISPPEGYQNKPDRVWVMGAGEPVAVLVGEFQTIQQ